MRDKTSRHAQRAEHGLKRIVACLVCLMGIGVFGVLGTTALAQQIDGASRSFTVAPPGEWSLFEWYYHWDRRLEATENVVSSFPAELSVSPPDDTNDAYFYSLEAEGFVESVHLSDLSLPEVPQVMIDAMEGWIVICAPDDGVPGVGNMRVYDPTGALMHSATDVDYRDVGWSPRGDLWALTEDTLLVYDSDGWTTSNALAPLGATFVDAQVFTFAPTWHDEGYPAIAYFAVSVAADGEHTTVADAFVRAYGVAPAQNGACAARPCYGTTPCTSNCRATAAPMGCGQRYSGSIQSMNADGDWDLLRSLDIIIAAEGVCHQTYATCGDPCRGDVLPTCTNSCERGC